jgi:large subunit ribosomal protein L20
MARSTNRIGSRKRRKRLLKRAEGYYGRRKSTVRTAHDAVMKAGEDAYRGRKQKKRDYRALWITRISAATRSLGVPYSRFMRALTQMNSGLNRKSLSEMAIHQKEAFASLVESAKKLIAS